MKTCFLTVAMVTATLSSASAFELNSPRQNQGTAYSRQGGGIEDWVGFAATPGGRTFQTDRVFPSEEQARQAARVECERTTGRTCPPEMTISIGSDFDVVAFVCKRGSKQGTYWGGSKQNHEDDSAVGKAVKAGFSPNDCRAGPRY